MKSCKDCTIFTDKPTKEILHPFTADGKVWENIHVDLFGPMPDKKHILVAIDETSRFPAAKIVPNTAAQPVIDALDQIYTDFGVPGKNIFSRIL